MRHKHRITAVERPEQKRRFLDLSETELAMEREFVLRATQFFQQITN